MNALSIRASHRKPHCHDVLAEVESRRPTGVDFMRRGAAEQHGKLRDPHPMHCTIKRVRPSASTTPHKALSHRGRRAALVKFSVQCAMEHRPVAPGERPSSSSLKKRGRGRARTVMIMADGHGPAFGTAYFPRPSAGARLECALCCMRHYPSHPSPPDSRIGWSTSPLAQSPPHTLLT